MSRRETGLGGDLPKELVRIGIAGIAFDSTYGTYERKERELQEQFGLRESAIQFVNSIRKGLPEYVFFEQRQLTSYSALNYYYVPKTHEIFSIPEFTIEHDDPIPLPGDQNFTGFETIRGTSTVNVIDLKQPDKHTRTLSPQSMKQLVQEAYRKIAQSQTVPKQTEEAYKQVMAAFQVYEDDLVVLQDNSAERVLERLKNLRAAIQERKRSFLQPHVPGILPIFTRDIPGHFYYDVQEGRLVRTGSKARTLFGKVKRIPSDASAADNSSLLHLAPRIKNELLDLVHGNDLYEISKRMGSK